MSNVTVVNNGLCEKIDGEWKISYQIISKNTNNDAISIRKLIDKYMSDFKSFGVVSFKMTKTTNTDLGNGRPSKIYYLNEQQATFLMTLLRNSKEIVYFKKTLVKTFYDLRTLAQASVSTPKLENKRELNLPNEDFREVLEKSISKLEEKNNCTFVELIEYDVRQRLKNGKLETYKKVSFVSKER
ncbi:Rha family transcriptional regulator [Sulfurospirillum cavolei]|uniref:Rha family transcriptional regulator n=1 Tax=Sulfurospirillum cavolei TaxID=366522 RepID=UPI003FA277B6